jgi:SAM-dependent methyltransferase
VAAGTTSCWDEYQPGFRNSHAARGSTEFFSEVEAIRYALEPHILELVPFADLAGCDVLEAGCGIGTDGCRFAQAGARYTGLDRSETALALARRNFVLTGLTGEFVQGTVTSLPFPDETFDLAFSHGVIHHVHDTQAAVDELERVLRPGGRAIVMVYHRRSFNYHVTIMGLRRLLAWLLVVPGAPRAVARLTHEDPSVLEGHRRLLRAFGLKYLTDTSLFLSRNTDGPGNPLSKAFTRDEAAALFRRFADVRTTVRYLNLRIYPGGMRFARTALGRRLERRYGWHLFVDACKRR